MAKKTRIPSQLEIYKGIRKEPVPPSRTIQPRNRDIREEEDDQTISEWMGWRGEDLDEYDDYE